MSACSCVLVTCRGVAVVSVGWLSDDALAGLPLGVACVGQRVTTEWEAGTLFELLGDELARKILALSSVERLSADAISDRCDSSQPTVYRRLDELQDYDLLEEYTEYDADGNHYQTYGCRLDEVAVGIDEGTFTVDVQLRREVVDDETLETVGDAAPTGREPVEKSGTSAAGGEGESGGR